MNKCTNAQVINKNKASNDHKISGEMWLSRHWQILMCHEGKSRHLWEGTTVAPRMKSVNRPWLNLPAANPQPKSVVAWRERDLDTSKEDCTRGETESREQEEDTEAEKEGPAGSENKITANVWWVRSTSEKMHMFLLLSNHPLLSMKVVGKLVAPADVDVCSTESGDLVTLLMSAFDISCL